jgi:hypothetical protein
VLRVKKPKVEKKKQKDQKKNQLNSPNKTVLKT